MRTSPAPTVAITGASGYLGGVIRERVSRAGWQTVDLVRTPSGNLSRRYHLDEEPAPDLLAGVDVLVHCAYDMTVTRPSEIWRVNVEGTRRLLELASCSNVRRTVVLSSMSAFEGTIQLYGLSKLAIERDAKRFGAVSVRPGLVYGPRAGGMAGALAALAKLPVIPVIASRSYQFTIHEDDFADSIAALLTAEAITSDPIGIANPHPVRFRRIVEDLAHQAGRRCRIVPLNWHLVHVALQLCEQLHVSLPFRADSVLGLANPAPVVANVDVLDELGIEPRRFGQPVFPRQPFTRRQIPLDRYQEDGDQEGSSSMISRRGQWLRR